MFLFLSESLDLKHVIRLRSALGDQKFEDLDLVIHSGGGSIHAAYQVVELLRLHAEHVHACVPLYAKSAATLLCLGAEDIVVDELAELGPLDTQIYEEKKGDKMEFTSALNPFKTLEQLRKFSLETLDIAVKMIAMRSHMDLDESEACHRVREGHDGAAIHATRPGETRRVQSCPRGRHRIWRSCASPVHFLGH